ncbi:BRO-N domain-containing protein [Streptomyces lateritius]|uniref:BRO-N domain-containing protein n=1 Tax=Streptomyces lateritius TaxID=67313 RepID=UPI001673BD06|nr:Bro-N domain-containing protein [Streptomyces lateritius]GGT67526.1 DNA-binding protein [Streptomyces lateritius]
MDEQHGQKQDAIDIDDFVYAATGARVRRLTMPDGTHWFPAVDVAGRLGYGNTRDALRSAVPQHHTTSLADLVRTVGRTDGAREVAGHGLKKSMRMVDLQGLVHLVSRCAEPEAAPFKAWVADVVATVQRDGSYALEPSPLPSGHVMPQQVADIIVRLEGRNRRLDEEFAVWAAEQHALLRETSRSLSRIADSLERIAVPGQRQRSRQQIGRRPAMTPQELLASWNADRLPVTGDVRAVAACLAPALLRGGARYRPEEIARRTGLAVERVRDCVGLLVERGCVRQIEAADGARIHLLP